MVSTTEQLASIRIANMEIEKVVRSYPIDIEISSLDAEELKHWLISAQFMLRHARLKITGEI